MGPDWLYDGAERFQTFMDEGSLGGALLMMALACISSPLLVLVHELGHALAVRARGLPLRELRVGDTADLTIHTPRMRFQIGRHLGRGDVGGYVLYDGSRATPMDVLVIALAGPAANLVGAVATGVFAAKLGAHGPVAVVPWLMTLAGVSMGVFNLVPSGGDGHFSDGRWAQVAWAALRRPQPQWEDPRAATSTPPPRRAG